MNKLTKNLKGLEKQLKKSKTSIVLSAKSYEKLLNDLPNAKITIHAKPMPAGHKRKII